MAIERGESIEEIIRNHLTVIKIGTETLRRLTDEKNVIICRIVFRMERAINEIMEIINEQNFLIVALPSVVQDTPRG